MDQHVLPSTYLDQRATVFTKDKTDDIRGVWVGVVMVSTSKVDCIVLYCIVLSYHVPSSRGTGNRES